MICVWSTNHPVIIVLQLAVRDYVSQTYELDVSSVDNVLDQRNVA